MSDLNSWKVQSPPTPGGKARIVGWPARSGRPGVVEPDVQIDVAASDPVAALVIAHLIVAAVQAVPDDPDGQTPQVEQHSWRGAPDCAGCADTGTVRDPATPDVFEHCRCRKGRRLLDLYRAVKARDPGGPGGVVRVGPDTTPV
ncbi:hypothetical protein [Streptosporangium sp. CA-115845]|uniref:hypothetical protein n=1 Tax=Streptosporangium sp. CA-115845 TaxID=3240071 RepID=UPI003D927A0B